MNTSQFMDKQIMDLTSSQPNLSNKDKERDFIDLMNNPEHVGEDDGVNNGTGTGKEEIVPSYDFQPIRGGLSQSHNLDSAATARVWNSYDNKTNSSSSPLRNYGSLDSIEPAKFLLEKDRNDATIVSEIDKTIKKYVDNLLHVLESVGARITQLETRTRNLENSIDDLKVSVGENHGSTDGKMRQMENILREVQSGVIVLKDKQEIVEAQLQLAKLHVLKVDQQSESQSTGHLDSVQQAASSPLQSHLQPPPPPPPPTAVTFPQSVPPHPPTVVPAPPAPTPQQNLPPPVQLPNQFPQSQIPTVAHRETFFPPSGQTQDAPNQQYQVPPTPQLQAPPAPPPHQPYQPAPQPQYSQPPHAPQLPSSLGHLPEETAYIPPQNYPPNHRQPPSQPPSSPPSQPYFGAPPSHMYEPPSSRSSSVFPTGYGPQSGPSEPYPYGGPPSQHGSGSTMKPQQLSSASVQSGGSGYPQLPTARVLPQALPAASVGGGSGSPGTGNRVPIDDVVDKMTSMGFPRDHVRATVRKLTENGQSVDLNVVLDKLMNDGEVQPPRGWFGR